MSDLITQWQDNPKAFFENFPTKRKETEDESIKWFNNLSRKQIIESIGIGNFLTIIKDRLFNDLNYDKNNTLQNNDQIYFIFNYRLFQ
jgi:hypothetical protein